MNIMLNKETEEKLNKILNGNGIIANMNLILHPTAKGYYKLEGKDKNKDVILLSNYIDFNGDKKGIKS